MPPTADELTLVQRILDGSEHGDRALFDSLQTHEKTFVIEVLTELRSSGESHSLNLLWELDYKCRPVTIKEFLEDPYYLGAVGPSLYPAWREVLEEVFSPGRRVWEFILSGSIGSGKTTVAVVALLYKIYTLSCLRDPQKFFEMAPGSPIVFGLYNVFKYKVRTTSFAYAAGFLELSPYFRDRWPRNPRRTADIEFPDGVRVIHGSDELHSIGENIYACLVDEMDFMRAGATEEDKGQAYRLYTSTARRMESRYMRLGEIPGLMVLISSKSSQGGFIETRIAERVGDPRVFIADKPLWEVKPGRYSGAKFPVSVGGRESDSRLLTETEAKASPGKVIWVPVEHRQAFVDDVDAALRDIAGVATEAEQAFIPSRSDIYACCDATRSHPFSKQEFSITISSETAIEDLFLHDQLLRVIHSNFAPRVAASSSRYLHVDLGVTGDSAGIAMGHVAGSKELQKASRVDGASYTTRAPLLYIDFMLRIVPEIGTRIDFQKIRDFIYALRAYGFPIKYVSFDGWQSEDSVQQLLHHGFEAGILSMDRPPKPTEGHPYSYLRQAILEHRISYYAYERFLTEAVNLKRSVPKATHLWRVDHPVYMLDSGGRKVRGSKDVADAVGGVVRHCMVLDPATQDSALPLVGAPPPARQRPRFMDDDEWVMGDDIDFSRVSGIIP